MKFEIRQVDAWQDECGWTWNNSIPLSSFEMAENADAKQTFLKELHKIGLKCPRGYYVAEDDVLEIRHRGDDEPILAMVEVA